ncbi:MAG: glycoside hydrolase [Candidatus Dormibacteraeota bacterium]|nr:glycoside hydrolase [Candidatus Dormibacteraeota bacterium]
MSTLKRWRAVGVMGLTLAAGATTAAAVPPSAASPVRPTVVRDVEAGRDLVPEVSRSAAEQAVFPLTRMHDTTAEPSIAVDPKDPRHAVTVYHSGRNIPEAAFGAGFATTFDAGRTWLQGNLPITTSTGGPFELVTDVMVIFLPDSAVIASVQLTPITGDPVPPGGIVTTLSRDGGTTWAQPVRVARTGSYAPAVFDDKQWMTVDPADGPGHHRGRLYVGWDIAHLGGGIGQLSYSDDDGATWAPPVSLPLGTDATTFWPVVLKDGDLALVYSIMTDTPAVEYVVALVSGAGSVKSGLPLVVGPPVPIAPMMGTPIRQQGRVYIQSQSVAYDPGNGRMYVAWTDARFRLDGVDDAVITWSDDKGATWAPVKRINPGSDADFLDRWTPMLAVAPGGRVDVAYRQRQEAADIALASNFVDTIYQYSEDGGASFSEPLTVDQYPSDIRFSAISGTASSVSCSGQPCSFLGDYFGIASAGDLVYVSRSEGHRASTAERATFPPTVYHQRDWVAVIRLPEGTRTFRGPTGSSSGGQPEKAAAGSGPTALPNTSR